MKKTLLIIGAVILAGTAWLFSVKPQPPFGGDKPIVVSQEPAYFAEIDENGIVLRVIVISQENINTGKWGDPSRWVQTSPDGGKGKNYAGPGYTYDSSSDTFIAPKPFDSWILDSDTAKWVAPVIRPGNAKTYWDETNETWKEF